MMRAKYFKELEELKTEVILYGSYIEGMCRTLQKAFVEGDYEEAKLMVDEESTIRSKERRIENDCLRIMSTQQPVAKDLRFISSVLKIANNLQRIGGHVIEIVELLDFVGPINNLFAVNQLIDMNSRVMVMLKKALDSFVENNLELAEEVIASDNEVDALLIKPWTKLQTASEPILTATNILLTRCKLPNILSVLAIIQSALRAGLSLLSKATQNSKSNNRSSS